MDLDVRHRFASMRRSFLTLGWQAGAHPSAGLESTVDGTLPSSAGAQNRVDPAIAIDWRPEDPGLFDSGPDLWSQSPETKAAVFNLAGSIRAEAVTLRGFAAAAREQSDRVTREQSAVASRALAMIADAPPLVPGSSEAVAALNAIVREVSMTALNVSLAAIRAGAATRAFAAVTREVEELSQAVRHAWEDIECNVSGLEDGAAAAAAVATDLRGLASTIQTCLSGLIAPFPGAAARLAATALPERLETLRTESDKVAAAAQTISAGCEDMANRVETLAEQLIVIVRETPVADRRAHQRVPFDASCQLQTPYGAFDGRTLDLSRMGALVRLRVSPALRRGEKVTLVLRDIGPVLGTIAALSERGTHITFDLGLLANAAVRPAILAALDGLAERNDSLVARCNALATEVSECFATAVAEGEVDFDELIRGTHIPIRGTDPLQYEHPALSFYEARLPPILAARCADQPDVAYAIVMDRAGYVPVHTALSSLPPRVGDRPYNLRHSRNKRIFDDHAAQRAARNLRDSLVQVVHRDFEKFEIDSTVKAVSVPIFVGGRHWGCAELGFLIDTEVPLAAAERSSSQV